MSDAATAHTIAPTPTVTIKLRGAARGGGAGGRAAHSKNKTWVAGRAPSAGPSASASLVPEGRWERARGARGGRGRGGRGRGGGAALASANVTEDEGEGEAASGAEEMVVVAPTPALPPPPPPVSAMNGVLKTWDELVKTREAERIRAIREGKMDDPNIPKRLEDAITIVGTCQDMCPEFERYRRERENNLDKWECLVGPDGKPTKKVDHARAVKIYERGQGDKIIPSDLRPAPVLKRTLDYLFHDLIPRGGFAETQAFVRDRSRAVRNDFTIQQDTGPVAMECHERCTRFHILSLHLMAGVSTFGRALEMQQLMNSLLSLKEFYDDQRGKYQSPNELEMRIYHRLGLIRDQHERNDKPPPHIAADPAFMLITRFRMQVQAASSPITKVSQMKVDAVAMQTFSELANVLRSRGNVVMIYLVACFLEHIFGKDTIDDIESIRGPLTIQDIIDGNSVAQDVPEAYIEEMDAEMEEMEEMVQDEAADEDLDDFLGDTDGQSDYQEASPTPEVQEVEVQLPSSQPALIQDASQRANNSFRASPAPPRDSIFKLGASSSFAAPSTKPAADSGVSVFGKLVGSQSTPPFFGKAGTTNAFGGTSSNVFGGPVFGVSPSTSAFPSAKVEEPSKQAAASPFSSTSFLSPSPAPPVSQPRLTRPSLADAAPLPSSSGEQDKLSSSEVLTSTPPPPFTSSRSTPLFNTSAPPFVPKSSPIPPSITFTPPPPERKASLTPLQTDSLRQTVLDPNRRSLDSPSPSYPFPSPSKATVPSSLSIDTGVPSTSTGQTRKLLALDSPAAPPSLGRKAPISLPGTPTGSFSNAFINNAMPSAEPISPLIRFDYPSPRLPTTPATTSFVTGFPSSSSLLSPGTPERIPTSPLSRPSSTTSSSRPSPSPPANGSASFSNGIASSSRVAEPVLIRSKSELREEALHFARTRSIARSAFSKWKQKWTDLNAWRDAVKRSDTYKQKLSESGSVKGSITHSSSSSKRQREVTVSATPEPARVRRRTKPRISHPDDVRTDEELVARLARNKKKNEHRWARGTFMSAIREDLRARRQVDVPPNWTVWLCMNQSNDQTAIWLEQKFDVPNSGSWESEVVFSMPVSTNPSLEGFPGLIIFECTPLEGVDDEIDRKYHILDDLARLRDVIALLPERRHYIPSLLVVNWDSQSASDIASDIQDMITKSVNEEVLGNTTTLPIHFSDDLDQEFKKCVTALEVDLSGKLVEWLTLKELFDRLASSWSDAASVWVDACTDDDLFDWVMFSHVLDGFLDSLNAMLRTILSSWSPSSSGLAPLSKPVYGPLRDEDSVQNAIRAWLQLPIFDTDFLETYFSFSDLNEDFEARAFLNRLLELAFLHIQRDFPGAYRRRAITKKSLQSSSESLAKAVEESQGHLRKIVKTLPRASPRRSMDGQSTAAESVQSVSRASSPMVSISAFTNGTKKQRLSMPSAPESSVLFSPDDDVISDTPPSPSPSAAPSVAESSASTSHVSLAMLRELSRNVLSTYGSSKSSSLSKTSIDIDKVRSTDRKHQN